MTTDYKPLTDAKMRAMHKEWLDSEDATLACLMRSVEQATISNCRAQHAEVERDAERIDFHIAQSTSWYPNRTADGRGILCWGHSRYEVRANSWREAIDAAIAAAKGQA